VVGEGQRIEAQLLGGARELEKLRAGAAAACDGESERALDHVSLLRPIIRGAPGLVKLQRGR